MMQGDEPLIHIMYEEMGKLLSSLVYKFIKNTHPYKSYVETLELKLIEELVKFDVTKKKHVRSSINIGMKAKILFNSPLLSNDAKKIKFQNECLSFYQVVTTHLQEHLPFHVSLLSHSQYLQSENPNIQVYNI